MTWKIKQPTTYQEVEKRLHETFDKDTDYDLFHKHNGRIVVHFWDEKYLENFPHKDGRKKEVITYEPVENTNG